MAQPQSAEERPVESREVKEDGTCGEMEHARGLAGEDNDCVAVFFAQPLTPAGYAFSAKQGRTEGGKDLRRRCGSGGWTWLATSESPYTVPSPVRERGNAR